MATGKELAEEMADSVNSGINSEDLADALANEHRYLQSEVFKQVFKPTICEFARQAESGNHDRRNKKELQECKEIADAMGWHY